MLIHKHFSFQVLGIAMIFSRLIFLGTILIVSAAMLSASAIAQGADATTAKAEVLGSEYIPIDATLLVEVNVASTMASPQFAMYPIEVIDAWAKMNLGIHVSDIEKVRIVVAAPGPGDPLFALLVMTSKDVDIRQVSSEFADTTETIQVDRCECYRIPEATGVVMHQKGPRTLVIAAENYLGSVLRSSSASSTRGSLARLAESSNSGGNINALASIESVRPLAVGMLQPMLPLIPPPVQPLMEMPQLLDAIQITVDIDDITSGTMKVEMIATDESAAQKAAGLISNGLQIGRQIALAQMINDLDPKDPMANATRKYIERISGLMADAVTPTVDGNRLAIAASPSQGIVMQGALVGMLLPAVQAARQASARMTSANQLKQLGLAMFNYHEVYGEFPGDIKAKDGTPLLSWRVAILPFLEQNELYREFRRDEPWNSPHNLALAERMPDLLKHPELLTRPNETVYLRPVGPQFLMEGHDAISMGEITDGLSNTIMMVETAGSGSVPWTKPTDLTIDLDNPVLSVSGGTRDGFNVLIADGSVQYVSSDVDAANFKAFLTRNGLEVVPQF